MGTLCTLCNSQLSILCISELWDRVFTRGYGTVAHALGAHPVQLGPIPLSTLPAGSCTGCATTLHRVHPMYLRTLCNYPAQGAPAMYLRNLCNYPVRYPRGVPELLDVDAPLGRAPYLPTSTPPTGATPNQTGSDMTATRTTRRSADRPTTTTTPADVAEPTTPADVAEPTTPADVVAALITLHQTTPDHGERVAAVRPMLSDVAAFNDDADVAAAFAAVMDPTPWIDPYGAQRRRAAVLAAAMADVLSTLPDDDAVSDVVGSAAAGWVDVDPALIDRVAVAVDPPVTTTLAGRSGTGTRTVVDRRSAAVAGMTFAYRGRSVTVGRDGTWTTDDGVVHGSPSRAARHVNGGTSVNGWRDAWRDADGNAPDAYATT